MGQEWRKEERLKVGSLSAMPAEGENIMGCGF
jgi:hypothetical protein